MNSYGFRIPGGTTTGIASRHNSIGSLCHRFPVSREERLYAVSDGGYPGAGVGDFFHGHELDAYLAAG